MQAKDIDEAPERLLRARDVVQRIGVSRSMLFNMIRTGEFPAGVKITKQRVGWREAVVNSWIRERSTS